MGRAAALALVLGFASPAVLPTSRDAYADGDPAPADPIAEAQKLADEAKEFEKVAGDPDADGTERRTARKTAFEKLKKARELLDVWLDKHPDDNDRLDKLYCEIAGRFYWIKKMSSLEELGGEKPS